MTKKQKYNTEDNRGVAIYARKSRITNKGDSIGVQFKQCAEYAKRELHLNEDYTFLEYEDKGLSGYYSDRPDFQRMLHDIEMGKIRAVVCYKLDRIGRKTSDLLRLLDFLEKHKVDLLICSNNINTSSGVSKIFIQIFAVVAEFERDTLTERITDNMMELAKDGRWLGGNTPTGFTVRRVKTGSGKNKSAYSYLESIPEEKSMIQKLYEIFASTRSIKKTADRMNELGYRTKVGSKFNSSTTRLLLKNPVYCTADESAYNYFLEHNGGLCGDISDFDGQHGISAYNKTDQEKFEDADSTFISPKFVQLMSAKPLSEWIISVGRHEGFISSRQWIDTQNMLDDIAEKYNRPHRKTNALLAGLVYCPHCGKRLRVISESNRWTNGKPRFKYICPGYRAGECTFRAVDGVLLDEFVVKQLSHLADEDSEYFEKLLNQKASDIFSSSQNEKELSDLRKKKAQLETAIANQVKNLREADDSLKRFIQEDVKSLTDELAETDTLLQKLEDSRQSQMYAIRDIEEIKERLLSFGKYAENAAPDVLVTLIQTFVERIYITDENDERHCHIFIKGCSKEDYDDFFRATGYIENTQETGTVTSVLPVCDSDECCKSYNQTIKTGALTLMPVIYTKWQYEKRRKIMNNRREVLKYFEMHKDYMDARVKEGIEKYRKGDFKIRVVDQNGSPVEVKISAELQNHAFNFGANIFMLDTLMDWPNVDPVRYKGWPSLPDYKEKNELYKKYYTKMFNFATLPFYWQDTEPENGKLRFFKDEPHIHRRPPVGDCLKFCKENDIRTKAHCLNYDGCCGQWVKDLKTADEVKHYMERRMKQCAENFAGDIKGWEVTNETLVLYPQPAGETKFYFDPDFVHWSFVKAREYFPNNTLIINDNHETVWQYYLHTRSSYYMQIKQELAQGTPIDTIGMQYHFFYKREAEMKMAEKFYNPKFIYEVLDTYSDFNLPMQITEITIPSYSNDAEDEEIQAEILKNLYAIWFSYPNMEAIVYWNLVEGYLGPVFDMAQGENYYYGGFLRKDFTLKPAYQALYNLIHKQWHTSQTVTGQELGFRGFFGIYKIIVEKDGKKSTYTADFTKETDSDITITV